MQTFVEGVIYFYVFICVLLMAFNLLYIARSSRAERRRERRERYWKTQIQRAEGSFVLTDAQMRRLRNIQHFAAFQRAITLWMLGTEGSDEFFMDNARQIQALALAYVRHEAMERAFVASFIASFRCPRSQNAGALAEIMLSYLEDSTVFCRENVLQALYALGRPHAVENALHIINEHGWYHSPKLLSDGMTLYTGDKEELVRVLWRNRDRWAEPFVVAVVQFASFLESEELSDRFRDALMAESVDTETRFALIRYFQRHPRADVLPYLLDRVREDGPYAVPAAGALANYDPAAAKPVLAAALHSGAWHVRHNAALSLMRLGFSAEERAEVVASGDRYACDMLDYVMGPVQGEGAA